MAIAEIQTLPITHSDDAVQRAWEYILETKCSQMEAVTAIWPECRFDDVALQMLAMDGLAHRIEMERHYGTRRSSQPAVGWGTPHGRKWESYLNSLTHPYQGADGAKALYEFNRGDLAVFAVKFRTVAEGYLRRASWADDVLAILDEHDKDCIKDLPAQALKQVAEAASEAFGRQE